MPSECHESSQSNLFTPPTAAPENQFVSPTERTTSSTFFSYEKTNIEISVENKENMACLSNSKPPCKLENKSIGLKRKTLEAVSIQSSIKGKGKGKVGKTMMVASIKSFFC